MVDYYFRKKTKVVAEEITNDLDDSVYHDCAPNTDSHHNVTILRRQQLTLIFDTKLSIFSHNYLFHYHSEHIILALLKIYICTMMFE